MERHRPNLYEFGPFRLDMAEHLLLREGERVALTPKAFETLVALVERPGRLVSKDELMKAVWPDTVVEEANLTNNVWALRKTLGEGQNGESYIETVPKLGYRFTAPVRAPVDPGPELILEKHTRTRIVTEEEDFAESKQHAAPASAQLTLASNEKQGRPTWQLGTGVALVVLLAVGLLALYRSWLSRAPGNPETPAASQPPIRSIAVLPFKTLGGGTDDEYLSLGMSDALIARLGNIHQLIVRPASAVRRYTDAQHDAVTAGRQQGVDAVLDGSVHRAGDRIRVIVQLVRVQDRAVLWSGQFDEKFTGIFAVQDSISQQVAEGLRLKLSDEERGRFGRSNPENVEAYQAYLKGRYFWNKRTPEGYNKAIVYFEQAIELDPAYARPYSGLADALLFVGESGNLRHKDAVAKARAALKRAIEIDETLAEAHASQALMAMNFDWDWVEAERKYKRAIELNPNYATAHHWYGEFLAYMGRFDEGLAEIKRAQEIDPLSLIISTDLGKIYFLARQYDRAVDQLKRTLEMDSYFRTAHFWLGFSYSFMGKHKEAIAEFNKIPDVADESIWLAGLGYVYGAAGQREEAKKVLKRMTALSKENRALPVCMMLLHVGLGEKDEAFRWYDKIFEEHTLGVIDLKVSPVADNLRSDPRFTELLRRAHLTG